MHFVEDLPRNYPVSVWINTERARVTDAIDRAATGSVGN